MRLIGTGACPRFDECPVLEPLICKKIAHERLTALIFREDCFVTACQDGYVYTWARPGKMVSESWSLYEGKQIRTMRTVVHTSWCFQYWWDVIPLLPIEHKISLSANKIIKNNCFLMVTLLWCSEHNRFCCRFIGGTEVNPKIKLFWDVASFS
jgi:hypothetical protein